MDSVQNLQKLANDLLTLDKIIKKPLKFQTIKDSIEELQKVGFEIASPDGAFYIFAKIPANCSQNSWDFVRDLAKEAKSYEDDNFKVIFRENAFLNKQNGRSYSHCYGCNFITTLNSAGDLATCLPYWNKEGFVYGNIYQDSFYEIWNGEKRKKIKSFLERDLNCQKCPTNCRPNAINEFLNDILHRQVSHVNFI